MRSLWISGVVLFLDQASKRMVMESMFLGESIPVLGSFFRLTYIQNPGAVFGMRFGRERRASDFRRGGIDHGDGDVVPSAAQSAGGFGRPGACAWGEPSATS